MVSHESTLWIEALDAVIATDADTLPNLWIWSGTGPLHFSRSPFTFQQFAEVLQTYLQPSD